MDDAPATKPHFKKATPDGDDRERDICGHCGFIDYRNPKIVVGSVLSFKGEILLCRRAIEPRRGFWTLPAGFLELGETAAEGAKREAFEEARARPQFDQVLGVYSVPRISQVQIFFRGTLAAPEFSPGPESLDVKLFHWDDIPWSEIAFPTVFSALRHWRETKDQESFPPFTDFAEGFHASGAPG